jgi:acetyltransferase EpsM
MSYMYLYGAGGHSKVILDILESHNIAVETIFDDDPPNIKNRELVVKSGIRLLGGQSLGEFDAPFIISVGNNARRAEIACLLNVRYGKAIHKSAIVSHKALVGDGSVILHGSIIQAGARLGEHVLVNTAASIDHDNIIGDFAHISPHATLCGHVTVGEGTHVGAGAVVIPSITIGRWSTIGAGAVVIRNIPDFAVAVGNPARVIKIMDPGQVLPHRPLKKMA